MMTGSAYETPILPNMYLQQCNCNNIFNVWYATTHTLLCYHVCVLYMYVIPVGNECFHFGNHKGAASG